MALSDPYDAVVVGAGHNGLVCAAYLARAGLKVLVLERRAVVGGAAVTEELFPGFRFDACAHLLGGLHPRLAKELKLSKHGLEVVYADPIVFSPLPEGGHLALWREPEACVEEIGRFSKQDAERWPRFGTEMARAVRFLNAVHEATPPELPPAALGELRVYGRLGARLRRLGRRAMTEVLRVLPMSAAELLDEWFESDPLKGALGALGVTGVIHGPRAGGTAYLLLRHLAEGVDVLRPVGVVKGGMGRLSEALAAAARRRGAEIRTEAPVERVLARRNGVLRVVLAGGEEIAARRVISNADPRRTFLGMVDPAELEPEFVRQIRNIRMRSAGAKVHLALERLPDFRTVPAGGRHLGGVIRIAPSLDYLERAADDAKYGRISREPYLEAVVPSLADPTLAPGGHHVMSVYVQYAPYHLRDGGWDDRRRGELAERVLRTLCRYAPGLEEAVVHHDVATPLDLETTYALTEGSPSHGEMALDQLFFMRPVAGWARYRTPLRGLYLCGAGTHPGGGVTGAPGFNAAREVLRDAKRRS